MRILMILCLFSLGFGSAGLAQHPNGEERNFDFERSKPMDLPCVQVTVTLNESGYGTSPWFRLFRDGRTAAVVSLAGSELVLERWEDGEWVAMTRFPSKNGQAVADLLAPAGFYRWQVSANQPGMLVPLCIQMPIDHLLTDFAGPDPEAADAAYFALFQMGEGAIPLLLNLTERQGKYSGGNIQNPASSSLELTAPDLRCVALYLIDAIYYDNPRPHLRLNLFNAAPLDSKTTLDLAVARYRDWWNQRANLSLKELRDHAHPLADTGLYWLGPVQDHHEGVHHKEPKGNSAKVPGSDTPVGNPMECVTEGTGPDPTNNDPFEWKLNPAEEKGPTPYNCLAWALGCQNDKWVQPTGQTSIDDILEDYGYNEPSTADGECPEGCGPKITMVYFQPCEPPNAPLEWVHAMKQESDGEWSSKNGQSCLFNDIKDPGAFLDCHYPPPKGSKRVVKYFCKKKKKEEKPEGR